MEMVGEAFSLLGGLAKEIAGALVDVVPKLLSFILWVLCGIIILPCVFISGTFFPKWTDWGEKNF
jgi:hypothetical protein